MRPTPFSPVSLDSDERFARDTHGGLMWHRVFHRPLYADTDRSGVVYHSNYFRYFEFGRATLMRDMGYPYRQVEENGYVYPIIELGAQYIRPLYYDDPMWIYTRPAVLERVRIRFEYLILHGGNNHQICSGFTCHCAVNPKGRPVAVDSRTVELWKNFPQ